LESGNLARQMDMVCIYGPMEIDMRENEKNASSMAMALICSPMGIFT